MSEDNEQTVDDSKNKIKCPCCGELTLSKPLNPRSELVDQWLACMLSSTPFHHVYSVYGGKMKVEVTQLSGNEINMADFAITLLQFIKEIDWTLTEYGNACPFDIDQMISSINLHTCIVSITLDAGGKTRTFRPASVVKAAADLLKEKETAIRGGAPLDSWFNEIKECEKLLTSTENMSAVPNVMILGIADAHNRLSHVLMDAGFDESFWDGIELA